MTANWSVLKLGDLCHFQAGGAFPRSEQGHKTGNYPFIKVSDMTLPANGTRIVTANNWVSEDTAARMRLKFAPPGSVAFAKIGEGLKAERLRQITRPTAMDNNMMAAVPKGGVIEPRFLRFLLESVHLASWAEGSALPYLRQKDLAAIPVTVPAMNEQRAIAATLGALDDKIESNRRTISLIDELVRARFDANFDLTQVSNGVSIAELVTVSRKLKLSRGTVSTYIGMSSLPEFSPSVLDWEKREFGSGQKFMNGDVLMARITPCLENGKTAVVDMLQEGEVGWGSTEYVVLSPKESISTPWIYALVRHPDLREWAVRRMSGTSGRQRFPADSFADYIISEPDSAQLDEFNMFALPLFERIAQLRDEIKKLICVRDTLLPEVLSGRIRIPTEGAEP